MLTVEYPDGARLRPDGSGGYEKSPFHTIMDGIYWVSHESRYGESRLHQSTDKEWFCGFFFCFSPWLQTVLNTTPLSKTGYTLTTLAGKIISFFLAYAGILCIALPVTIISKHFSRQYDVSTRMICTIML